MPKPSLTTVAVSALALVAASLGVASVLSNKSGEQQPPSLRAGADLSRRQTSTTVDVEVVLSHYKEKLDWIEEALEHDPDVKYTIYSKAEEPPAGSIKLQNVGRESHTFLHHIVHNYDSLAKWTVFSQAARPNFGFIFHNHESGHMCSGVTWEDYINAFPNGEDFFMVQTVATQFPQVWHSDRIDMMFRMPNSKGEVCPPNGQEGWGGWWSEKDHPLIKFQDKEEGKDAPSAVDFYNEFIVGDASDDHYDSFTLNFANGGRFAVSRDRIHRRPLSYYKALLQKLSTHVNPISGFYMETMWYDVFHPERLQAEYGPVCALPPTPATVPGHTEMHREAVQRTFGTSFTFNLFLSRLLLLKAALKDNNLSMEDLTRRLQASGAYVDDFTNVQASGPYVDDLLGGVMRHLQASGAYVDDFTSLQASGPYLDDFLDGMIRHLQASGAYLDDFTSLQASGPYLDDFLDGMIRHLQASAPYLDLTSLQTALDSISGPYLDDVTRHLQASGPYTDTLGWYLQMSGAYIDDIP